MPRPSCLPQLLAAGAVALATFMAPAAHAQGLAPAGFYVEGGGGQHGAVSLVAGVTKPWAWKKDMWGGAVTGYWEGYLANWSARDAVGSRVNYLQLGFVPMFRYRFDEGRSAWFADGGIGISYTDSTFRNEGRVFSTRWNFVDAIGFGRTFGAGGRHEISLRFQHVSNADIRKPNPGMDFLSIRYAAAF